jgi:hypothetical protein
MEFGRSKTQFGPGWLNSYVGISEETLGSETLVSRKGTKLIHAHYYLYVSDYTVGGMTPSRVKRLQRYEESG